MLGLKFTVLYKNTDNMFEDYFDGDLHLNGSTVLTGQFSLEQGFNEAPD